MDNTIEDTINWTRAYLEWMDGGIQASFVAGAEADLRKRNVFRETMVLMASRTDVDCLQIAETLRRAERLLEDEREAWRALSALKGCDRRRSAAIAPEVSSPGWEAALETLAADVHALESKVLALGSSARAAL